METNLDAALEAFQQAEQPQAQAEKPLTATELRAAARHLLPDLDPTLEEAIEEEKETFDLRRQDFSRLDCAFCPLAGWTVERSVRYYPATEEMDGEFYESSRALRLTSLSCTCSGASKHGQVTFCIVPELTTGGLKSYALAQEIGLREVQELRCGDYLQAVAQATEADLEAVAREMRAELLETKKT